MTEQEQAFWEWYDKLNQMPASLRIAFDAGYQAATNNNRKVTQ